MDEVSHCIGDVYFVPWPFLCSLGFLSGLKKYVPTAMILCLPMAPMG